MRLFTGLDLPAETVGRIDAVIAACRPLAKIRWSKAANLHVTTKFIGEWPAERLEELKSRLAEIPPRGPIEVAVRGFGWFPTPHNPRIFWAAIHAPQALRELAAATDAACAELGAAAETKPYTPHLTLARIEPRGGGPAPDLAPLRRAIASMRSSEFGSFVAREFHLYLSEPEAGGSRYTELASFPT